jgi:uncharacterized membrane protein YfcA
MLSDPAFYLVAIPAVLIFGISKGGFGGGLGIAAVPLMALVVSPATAAGIMLPPLILMDVIGVWAYRHRFDHRIVRAMLPGALAGIALAALAFRYLDDNLVRVLLGVIAAGFAADYFLRRKSATPPKPHRARLAAFWGGVAGFTSTVAHSGGPPANIYLLPLKLDKSVFVGSMIILFTLINAAKVVPYALLGLFTPANLLASLALAPVAAVGMLAGIWLHDKVDQVLFYRLCYVFVFLTGLKLIHDGLS